MRFSLRLNNDTPPDAFADLAAAAEGAGFDQLWVSHDLFLRSAPVLLTLAATRTSRIGLGAGILNPYSAHPAELAMTAATLREVTGGRFLLGLGAGAEEFLAWAGLRRPAPMARTREAVHALRALLAGGRPSERDDAGAGWTEDAYLRIPTGPTPIYLGVMSPGMLGLAGAVADGALPLLFPPEHYPVASTQAADGARAPGRDPDEVDVAACVWVSIDDDPDRARLALADKIAYYGPSFAPYLLARSGLSPADFAPVAESLRRHGPAAAARTVTPAMLRLGIAGTAAEVVDRCRGLVGQGARHLSFGPPLGPDPLAAVRALGRDVLPALREPRVGVNLLPPSSRRKLDRRGIATQT
ncbi:5,10-methylenetetrahydromethanopterin reductase [soil metagenome]